MVNIEKTNIGDALVITLVGSIEECFDFDPLFGEIPETLYVNTKGVTRINSVGVKGWVQYFQLLRTKRVKVIFTECSTAIIEQFNLIGNFGGGGSIESVCVPFLCTQCKNESVAVFSLEKLESLQFKLPAATCPKCQSVAVFDDDPEDYFYFLLKPKK